MPDFLANSKMNQVSNAGSIAPMTFICPDGTQGNFLCRQATAVGDLPLGVSQIGAVVTPNLIPALTNYTVPWANVAGYPGDQIAIYTSGDVAPIRLGTGGATPGAILTNDSSGTVSLYGTAVMITPFTGSRYMGGVALQSGNIGDVIELYILPGRA
jgi:hypothetical protein